ncbi:hypothetical protein GCM10027074_73290 [Streptomyces deserti]
MTRTPQPTPPTPSPGRARLAAALRELKGRTGLSMAGLAAKTTFSKSSWERYLNGKTLPPREAVQDLCRLAGEPEGRCLALWEIAESECSGRAAEATPAQPRTDTRTQARTGTETETGAPARTEAARGGHQGIAAVAVLASVSAVVAGSVAAALFLLPGQDGEPRTSPTPSATGPRCRGAACEGRSPMHMKCGVGPQTLATHRTATGAELQLRYSAACGSSWARMWQTRIGDRLEVTARGRGAGVHRAEIEDAVDAESYIYTPMTATRPGTVVRACFQPAADGARECFDGRVR